jgi:hypothetical protein
VQSTPFSLAGGTAAFGAVRSKPPGIADDDDDDDDDDDRIGSGPQRVELRESSISLDQVCVPRYGRFGAETDRAPQAKRIAMQSAWRNVG